MHTTETTTPPAPQLDAPNASDGAKDRQPFGAFDLLLAGIMGGLIVIVLAQVVWRYLFNSSLIWAEEISRYLFTWMIFIGAGLAVRDKTHITVDLVSHWLPAKYLRGLEIVSTLLVTGCLAALCYFGGGWVFESSARSALGLPINWMLYAALPAGCALALGYGLARLVRAIRRPHQRAEDTSCRG